MEIKENVPLSQYSTFRIGGPARFFVEIASLEELQAAFDWAWEKGEPVFILGGGSNLLFMDEGFAGLVIKVSNHCCRQTEDGLIECCAGDSLGQLVSQSIESGLTGMEWAAGIPGTVGGAVRGNAGAFGCEMKDVIESVEALVIKKGEKITKKQCTAEQCQFDYRSSIFKGDQGSVIWKAKIKLQPGDKTQSMEQIKEILARRHAKHPADAKSAGSVFKNPVAPAEVIEKFEQDKQVKSRKRKVPAGWLVERCELKGMKMGGAEISDQQGNFIINNGTATAQDVLTLISLIKTRVRNKYKIKLEEELQIVYNK